jgi:RNA polymerase sigma factor (sigma-70 family)
VRNRRRRVQSSVDRWLDNAGRQPLLTASGELHLGALVREWQDWPGGPCEAPPAVQRRGLRARDRLVASNLRLVALVVDRYRLPAAIALEDALQAGTVGLIRAAEKFDPARGYRFTTYSYLWIRQGIACEVDKMASGIRLPANVGAAMRGTRNGQASADQLEAAAPVWRGLLSLDAPVPGADDEARTLSDLIEGGRLELEQLGQAEAVSAALAAMAAADPDGLALLELHHGDGARMGELGQLENTSATVTSKRLRAATARLAQLPEVQMAMAS